MFATIIKKIFGSKSERDVKRLRPLVAKINALEESYQSLTDEQLKAKTQEFKDRYAKGESLDSMMCEAFAVVKNACRRMVGRTYQVCGRELVWDMIPFDVQIIGGIVLHQGKIAEMATGEGKTLVATMPLYLNALTGRNCQLVTVNDYLALRDSQWVGRVFEFLGLTVGCIQNSMYNPERKAQYACDITYGTNSEFGFDYLRDMGAVRKDQIVQRDYFYVIVDEVDSILIDEARTPLIISGPVDVSTHQFDKLQPLVASLYHKQEVLCDGLVEKAKEILDRYDTEIRAQMNEEKTRQEKRNRRKSATARAIRIRARKNIFWNLVYQLMGLSDTLGKKLGTQPDSGKKKDAEKNKNDEPVQVVGTKLPFGPEAGIRYLAQNKECLTAIRMLLRVKFGMPRHKGLTRLLLESPDLLKLLERYEASVRSEQKRGMLQKVQSSLYFSMDEKHQETGLTELGRRTISPDDPDAFVLPDLATTLHDIDNDPNLDMQTKAERRRAFQTAFAEKSERIQNISQLLRAYCLFEKDVDYVVMNGRVMIVDEHTGRILPGRRFSDGLHQALEAKEKVSIEAESQTLATITIQNYFRMYKKLAGMTGTAETEANEFHQIYKLDVVVIPTNRPCIREDLPDSIYRTQSDKFLAIVAETEAAHKRGQPVLLGTISVEDSELVSYMLARRNIPHNVLNAKNHARESEIIALAGRRGAVTVATNMAGRGTDIKLEPGVEELGGLLVIGSSRHDSRRIDRQLRGRCARQGDPGKSHFYVSLEDPLMRLFGADHIVTIMKKLGLKENEDFQHPIMSRSIETAQRRVEQYHFSIRKHTLEYDDVMNKQREVIYGFRRDILFSDDIRQSIFDIIEIEVGRRVDEAFAAATGDLKIPYNRDFLLHWLNYSFPFGFFEQDLDVDLQAENAADLIIDRILKKVHDMYDLKVSCEDPVRMKEFEKTVVLSAIDSRWKDHLRSMDDLRSSIGLRAYAQKDPLVEYKREAFRMFEELQTNIDQQIILWIFRAVIDETSFFRFLEGARRYTLKHLTIDQLGSTAASADAPASAPASDGASPVISVAPQRPASAPAGAPERAPGRAPERAPESMPRPRPSLPRVPYRRNEEKVGPNDPCPCGSGKKFKKCCGK